MDITETQEPLMTIIDDGQRHITNLTELLNIHGLIATVGIVGEICEEGSTKGDDGQQYITNNVDKLRAALNELIIQYCQEGTIFVGYVNGSTLKPVFTVNETQTSCSLEKCSQHYSTLQNAINISEDTNMVVTISDETCDIRGVQTVNTGSILKW